MVWHGINMEVSKIFNLGYENRSSEGLEGTDGGGDRTQTRGDS